ncbi:MAG: VCBS repeat-containing protein, partial [Myxococcota bacterium]
AGIVAADYNADGRLDVANSNHPGSVTVRINETSGKSLDVAFPNAGESDYALESVYPPIYGIAGVEGGLTSADWNGDGLPDIATADLGELKRPINGRSRCEGGTPEWSANTMSILLNTSKKGQAQASYADPVYFPIPGPAISITTEDFNLDGKPDLVTANTGAPGSMSVLTNLTEQGSFEPCFSAWLDDKIPAGDLPQGAGPTNPIAVDFNGDGKPDIATANWNIRTVSIWFNTTPDGGAPRPSFGEPYSIPTGDFYPLVLRTGDLDGNGLPDIVAIPLSTLSRAAMLVIRNETEEGSMTPDFVVDQVYDIPKQLKDDWLYTYFATAGVVADFDGDERDDVALVIAKASSLVRMMKPGNDILSYVDPGVPLPIVHAILPHESMLVVYRQVDAMTREPAAPVIPGPGAMASVERSPFCQSARDVLGGLTASVKAIGDEQAAAGTEDAMIRSMQTAHTADRLREVAAAGSGAIADDLNSIATWVDEMAEHVKTRASKHVDHDVEAVVIRATRHLHEACGDAPTAGSAPEKGLHEADHGVHHHEVSRVDRELRLRSM